VPRGYARSLRENQRSFTKHPTASRARNHVCRRKQHHEALRVRETVKCFLIGFIQCAAARARSQLRSVRILTALARSTGSGTASIVTRCSLQLRTLNLLGPRVGPPSPMRRACSGAPSRMGPVRAGRQTIGQQACRGLRARGGRNRMNACNERSRAAKGVIVAFSASSPRRSTETHPASMSRSVSLWVDTRCDSRARGPWPRPYLE
jgi:hypothetical protein